MSTPSPLIASHLMVALASWPACPRPVLEMLNARGPREVPIVGVYLAAHPAGDRLPAALNWMSWWELDNALQLVGAPVTPVALDLADGVPADVLSGYLRQAGPHAAAVQVAVRRTLAGQQDHVEQLLDHAAGDVHERLVTMVAPQMLDGSTRTDGRPDWTPVLTWLSHAVLHPDRLAEWVPLAPASARPVVSYFARLARRGHDVRATFVADLIACGNGGGLLPPWLGHPRQLLLQWPGAPAEYVWTELVDITGLEEIAAAALSLAPGRRVWDAVRQHPRLAGTRAAADAVRRSARRAAQDAGGGPAGEPEELTAATGSAQLLEWVEQGHTSQQELLAVLDRADRLSLSAPGWVLLGAELACMAVPGSRAWSRAVVAADDALTAGGGDQVPVQDRTVLAFAHARAAGGGVGPCATALADVGLSRQRTWLTAALLGWLQRLPQIGDPRFVSVLLDLAAQVGGTFDDLAATATAVLA